MRTNDDIKGGAARSRVKHLTFALPEAKIKKTLALVLVLTLGLVFGLSLTAEAGKSKAKPQGPRLTLAENVFDAGVQEAGSLISHDFVIKNTGSAELKIVKVTAGCGCTVAKFDRAIGAGQSGVVTIEVQSYKDWAGRRMSQSAVVESNDPDQPYLSLVIRAKLTAPRAE